MLTKLQTIQSIFIEALDPEESDTKILLKLIYKTFKYIFNTEKNTNIYLKEINKKIIYKLLLIEDLCEGDIIVYFIKILTSNSSYLFNFLEVLEGEISKEEKEEIQNTSTFYNIYNLIISIPVIQKSIKMLNSAMELTSIKLGKYISFKLSLSKHHN